MNVPTILVVDDDDSVREVTQMSLEIVAGWRVLSADGGQAALDLVRAHRPDAVLLDVMMPGMDGPTTLRHLQADPVTRDIPVVLLTAKVQVGHVQVWDSLPVAGVIPKPFNPATLSAQIDDLVAAHRIAAGTPEQQHSA